jgi:hypothetical protein
LLEISDIIGDIIAIVNDIWKQLEKKTQKEIKEMADQSNNSRLLNTDL